MHCALRSIYVFCLIAIFPIRASAKTHNPAEISSIYLSSDLIESSQKIAELEDIIRTTAANGIVIDFKDSNIPNLTYMKKLVVRYHAAGAYVIARIVTFQDSFFARQHPELALKTNSGAFWHSGRSIWKRYWVDPASEQVQDYNIEIAKKAVDVGFDEIQFDYIRFPTDGNMKDLNFPIFNPDKQSKSEVMENFFMRIRRELKSYNPNILIGIDVFGEVFVYGKEHGIGQNLYDIAKHFDVLSPMAYPSHYKCGEFKVTDPNYHPYLVYSVTMKNALQFLNGKNIIIRPWVQAFTLRNIYGCTSKKVWEKSPAHYDTQHPNNIQEEIRAIKDQNIHGFMLWNVSNNFSKEIFKKLSEKSSS